MYTCKKVSNIPQCDSLFTAQLPNPSQYPPSKMAAAALVEATAACVGSLISTTFMYPLEVTKTKVQAYGGKSKTSASATGGAKLDAEVLLLLLRIPLFFLLCLPPLPPLPPIVLLLPSNSLQPAAAAAAAAAASPPQE